MNVDITNLANQWSNQKKGMQYKLKFSLAKRQTQLINL